MVQRGNGPGFLEDFFASETVVENVDAEELQGHVTMKGKVTGAINHAHSALTESSED
jgi:hypothetical protein